MFLDLLDEELDGFEGLITYQPDIERSAGAKRRIEREVSYFSLSSNVKDMLGMTFDAMSSISKQSIVAMNAMRPATRA